MQKNRNFHIYCCLCSNKVQTDLFEYHNVKNTIAAQKFFYLLAEGLALNGCRVFVNSILPINPAQQKKRFWPSENDTESNIEFHSLLAINLPIINNIVTFVSVFFKILFSTTIDNKNDIIVVDYLKLSINLAVKIASKIRGLQILAITTDLPGEGLFQKRNLKLRIRNSVIFWIKYDFYVCLTDDLNSIVNKNNRPFLIIEGLASNTLKKDNNKLEDKFELRTLVYAGGLHLEYGIKNLIDGFRKLPNNDLRLWFYGTGPFQEEIKNYSIIDPRIEYKGVVSNEILIGVLKKSLLLLNPRPSSQIFTRFSFPSKNIEFMSLGTPLITTKLPGIPKDHYPFVYFFEDETESGIFNKLQSVLLKSDNEIHHYGLACKNYIVENKNNIVQTKKIVNLVQLNIYN